MARAVSSVVGVVVLVGLVVLLAGAVGVAATGLADGDRTVPTVDARADAFVAGCPGCGPHDQVVSIEHRGGDPVEVAAIEVHTRFADRPVDSRLVDLPVENGGCNHLEPDDYEGSDIYEGGCTGVRGALDGSDDGTWASGEVLAFRIPKSDVLVEPGDEVTVTVVDEESGAVVTEHTLEATDADPA